MPVGPKRTPAQREKDLETIAHHYLKGWSIRRIAEAVDLTPRMVFNDLRKIRGMWLESAVRDFDTMRSQELAKVDKLEATYWEAWDRSLSEFEKKSVKRKTLETGGQEVSEEVAKEKRDGNPAFLAGVERCIERRCKILGLDAPAKIEHGGALASLLSAAVSGGFTPPPPFEKPEGGGGGE